MQNSNAEAEIKRYLRSVEKNLRGVPAQRRKEIVREIEEHINQKIDDESDMAKSRENSEIAKNVLFEMGDPAKVARAYAPEPPKEHWMLRHIGKVATLSGLAILTMGLILGSICSDTLMSYPKTETNTGTVELSPGESKTISIATNNTDYIYFELVAQGNIYYKIVDPYGENYESGKCSPGIIERTINSPDNGIWKITFNAGVSNSEYDLSSNCIYEISSVPHIPPTPFIATLGGTLFIFGFFAIIGGGIAGLVNTIKRR